MFGTSYSGFNSLQMAAEGGAGALGAVVAMYATDDRYTDDVHWCGGVLRAIDLIDYPLYMVAMNALPPVPAVVRRRLARRVAAAGRRDAAVAARVAGAPVGRPDVAARLDPARPRRRRLRADGVPDDARRRMGRRLPQQHLPGDRAVRAQRAAVAAARRAVGATAARPRPAWPEHRRRPRGPRLLRRAPARRSASAASRAQLFVRAPVQPRARPRRSIPACGATSRLAAGRAARAHLDGRAPTASTGWRSRRCRRRRLELLRRSAAVGQPLDQRADNARSLRLRLAGRRARRGARHRGGRDAGAQRPAVRPRQRQVVRRVPRRHVGADHARHARPHPPWMLAGRPGRRASARRRRRSCPASGSTSPIELDATTWTLEPGHSLRLAIAGTDWPNCWPPPGPVTLEVDAASVCCGSRWSTSCPCRPTSSCRAAGRRPTRPTASRGGSSTTCSAGGPRWSPATAGTYDGMHGATVTDDYRGRLGCRRSTRPMLGREGSAAFEIRVARSDLPQRGHPVGALRRATFQVRSTSWSPNASRRTTIARRSLRSATIARRAAEMIRQLGERPSSDAAPSMGGSPPVPTPGSGRRREQGVAGGEVAAAAGRRARRRRRCTRSQ